MACKDSLPDGQPTRAVHIDLDRMAGDNLFTTPVTPGGILYSPLSSQSAGIFSSSATSALTVTIHRTHHFFLRRGKH